MTELATVRYTGERPFFLVMIEGTGRLSFNKHNNFSKELPISECEKVQKQWSKFFTIEHGVSADLQIEGQLVPPDLSPESVLAEPPEEIQAPRILSPYAVKMKRRKEKREAEEAGLTRMQMINRLKKRMKRTHKKAAKKRAKGEGIK